MVGGTHAEVVVDAGQDVHPFPGRCAVDLFTVLLDLLIALAVIVLTSIVIQMIPVRDTGVVEDVAVAVVEAMAADVDTDEVVKDVVVVDAVADKVSD